MIGPLYTSEIMACAVGLILGFGWGGMFMLALTILSAGRPSAAKDRNDLLGVLSANGVRDEISLKIVKEGLTAWSKWRWKTRPTLWRWGFDWPEYCPATADEFQQHFEKFIPELPPSFAPSLALPEGPEELRETGPAELPAAFPAPSSSSETMSDDPSEVGS
jgi:hypothetical protein